MTMVRIGTGAILSLTLLFTSACATDGGSGGSSDGNSGSSSGAAPATGLGRIAVGAVEDTLQACMARIPSDATGGQRMLAERSCQRDQADRK
jgi:hypothetical protein